jgi:hypothetical protein
MQHAAFFQIIGLYFRFRLRKRMLPIGSALDGSVTLLIHVFDLNCISHCLVNLCCSAALLTVNDVDLLACDSLNAFSPEDADRVFLRNVGIRLRVHTT